MNKKRYNLTIPQNLSDKLYEEASFLGLTANALIIQILWEHFKK